MKGAVRVRNRFSAFVWSMSSMGWIGIAWMIWTQILKGTEWPQKSTKRHKKRRREDSWAGHGKIPNSNIQHPSAFVKSTTAGQGEIQDPKLASLDPMEERGKPLPRI